MTVSGLTMANAERQPLQMRDSQIHNSDPQASIADVFSRRVEAPRFGGVSARFSSWRADPERKTEGWRKVS
jgi:hypothetical protein